MNLNILNTEIQSFILHNLETDITSLLFSKTTFKDVNIKEIVEQIEAKKKCENKLPTWYNTPKIYYPNKLNIEQTSSEITAQYKSTIIEGNSIIDLTGGFGVDTFYFSKHFKDVTYCELNAELSEIVSYNFKLLEAEHINVFSTDGIDYLKNKNSTFDCIYLDPSRRHDSKGKVFYLKDCLPDITKHLDLLFQHSQTIIVKGSPMLDISIGLKELEFVKEIHIIAINNDVKELLFLLEFNCNTNVCIKTINIKKNTTQKFKFNLAEEKSSEPNYSLPKTYLYEPNNAILKSGAFNSISSLFNIEKLHKHSHLYTSEKELEFPGRRFKIVEILPYSKKIIAKQFSQTKANITTRNFPESVAQIRRKFNIKDGGEFYLFFTTNLNNEKIVIVTTQL